MPVGRAGAQQAAVKGFTARTAASPSSVAKAVAASRSCIFLAQSVKDVIPPSHYLAF